MVACIVSAYMRALWSVQVTIGTEPEVVFKDADWALMIGAKPRGPGMERGDLLDMNGRIFVDQVRPEASEWVPRMRRIGRAARGAPLISATDVSFEVFLPPLPYHSSTRRCQTLSSDRAACQHKPPPLYSRGWSMGLLAVSASHNAGYMWSHELICARHMTHCTAQQRWSHCSRENARLQNALAQHSASALVCCIAFTMGCDLIEEHGRG